MKLKAQREDLKWLRAWPKEHGASRLAREVADHLEHLILLAEEADKIYYRGIYTTRAKRVIEDGEVGK